MNQRTMSMTTSADARFTDLLGAEWIKLWSLRSTYWALGASALAIIAFNANSARVHFADFERMTPVMRDANAELALRDAFTSGAAMILILAAASIGAITLVGEYGTGLIRTTFAAVPARRALVTAKLAVVTAVMTAYGAFVAGASFAATQAILSGRNADVPLSYPGAWRVVVASALLAPVCALAGMCLGAAIRHSATTMVAVTVLLLLLPAFITDRYRWTAAVRDVLPFNAWTRLVDMSYGHNSHIIYPRFYPATVTGSWVAFGAWAVVAGIVAVVVVDRRDV
ncbi:ABC transporter permease [Streptomyces sp. WI04-05B]|uniref:ABC transporter permease n=1 Tax=Streptomyces TaxID=1883 RepID=UPI0029A0D850|nr:MULTISPECIES: ABC transporter permease [unclassified Streptomyces]MDX2540296.1 ABC transporter permease [Streptomyces sp. WI04-05B]MDX2585271.1 ABC transporter permease [Streptomyces sp. WI04-05A]